MKQAVISGLVYTSIYLARLNFSVAVGNIIGLQIATKCVSLGSAAICFLIPVESRLYFSNDFHD